MASDFYNSLSPEKRLEWDALGARLTEVKRLLDLKEQKFVAEHGCSSVEWLERKINEHFAALGMRWAGDDLGWVPINGA